MNSSNITSIEDTTYTFYTSCNNCKKELSYKLPFGKRVIECDLGLNKCTNCGCFIWETD